MAKRAGINTEAQARALAKQRGMTDAQIDAEMQKRGLTPGGEEAATETPQVEPGEEEAEATVEELVILEEDGLEDIEDVSLESRLQPGRKALPYFGYDVFEGDPALFQASTLGAIDPHYSIGPGDEIIIMMWGETQFRQVFIVNREGFIFIPEVGQVFVNSITLGELERKLFRLLSMVYASINPSSGKASTFMDVSLGNLRPLRIMALGEVGQPGAYSVNPSTTLFTSLYYFQGLTSLGSLRDVRLIRGGKQIISIDLYDYLLTGKPTNDVRLQLDDVIFIPPRGKTVSIQGEIKREAIYELKKGEMLEELITIAGGLKATAYLDRAQVDRIVPFEERAEVGMDRILLDVDLNDVLYRDSNFALQDGDQVQLFSVLGIRQNVVVITGASVGRPGVYDMGDSLRLSELIIEADSLLGDAYLEQADIVRLRADLREELIKVNLGRAMAGDKEHDLFLQPLDRVKIYSLTEMIPGHQVVLSGHVKRPGRYSLLEKMTLYDLLFPYGGYIDEEWRRKTYLGRADLLRFDEDRITHRIIRFNLGAVLDNPESPQNLALMPGDIIKVYSMTVFNTVKQVTIEGAVKNPGQFDLKTGMILRDLILEAGGIEANVYHYKVEVARIDPENKSFNKFAKVLSLTMDEKFSVSEVDYSNNGNPDQVEIKRNGFLLEPYDVVSIRSDPYFSLQRKVTISGEVMYPGGYTILSPDEKITDIIKRAGGLRPEAYTTASRFTRQGQSIQVSFDQIIKNPRSNHNFNMQGGDEIVIVPRPNLVFVNGEVKNPGIRKFVPGKRIRYYIKATGGYTPDADKWNVFVQLPNGDSFKMNPLTLFSPKVMDGSVIIVGLEPPEEEPIDKTELAKDVASILADLAQVVIMVLLMTGG